MRQSLAADENLHRDAIEACYEDTKRKPDICRLPDNRTLTLLVSQPMGNRIRVGIKDNGPGIPESIRDKIFQPFFTTKPTGQGTGLGLSLSCDIIKAHGGELRLEDNGGEGATFVVSIPQS